MTETREDFDVALQTTGRPSGTHILAFTASDEVFPVCSPRHLDEQMLPLSLSDLLDHQLLHHRADPPDWMEWDEWLEQVGSSLRIRGHGPVFDSYPLMIQAALEGHGIGLGWRRPMEKLRQEGALVRPFEESVVLRDGHSVFRRAKSLIRPEAQALLSWLEAEFEAVS